MLEDERDDGGHAVGGEGGGRAVGVEADGQEGVAQAVHDALVQVLGEGGERERGGVGQRLEEVVGEEGAEALEGLEERLAHRHLVDLHGGHDLDEAEQRVVERGVAERREGLGAVGGRERVGQVGGRQGHGLVGGEVAQHGEQLLREVVEGEDDLGAAGAERQRAAVDDVVVEVVEVADLGRERGRFQARQTRHAGRCVLVGECLSESACLNL